MGRVTEDVAITSRAAREKLPVRHEPYWRGIEGGLALGYRKGARGGSWLARLQEEGRYRKEAIGKADDALSADGLAVLDFRQAQTKAREWAARRIRIANGLEAEQAPSVKPYSVADAMSDYVADYAARKGKALPAMTASIKAHILPALGDALVVRLTREKLKLWHRNLAASPARLRSKAGKEPRFREATNDPDMQRRRSSTANRILTILKAALNHARTEGKVSCNADAWAAVKPFRDVDHPKVRYLRDEEANRLMNACPADLRALVTAALLTGCRYGELAAIKVGDFDPRAGTIHIPYSKSGKARYVALTDEGIEFFKNLSVGQASQSLLLLHDVQIKQATRDRPEEKDRVAWGRAHQSRSLREACKAARISPAISFHILRHTYASRLIMGGAPLPVVATQLGHADTRITERHYAHLAPSYVADTVRSTFKSFGVNQPVSTVVPMRA